MNTLLKPKLLLGMSALVLACVFLSPLVALPVMADIGVRPILPDGSSLAPEDETAIVMQAEKVTLTVREAMEEDNAAISLNPEAYGFQYEPVWFSAIAEVRADFTMVNPTGETVSMTVWFPLASALEGVIWELNSDEIVPRIEGFQIKIDGKTIDYKVSELPNPQGEGKPQLPWASFPGTFPAGEEVFIQISYILPAKGIFPDREAVLLQETNVLTTDLFMNWYVNVGMIFNYIFQTGAGWAGPIGNAELVVNLPYPASAETILAMSEGGKSEGQQVRWTWENLKPGPHDDFSIWLITPERWEALQVARDTVETAPSDGQAWLKLCGIYHSLSFTSREQIVPGFGETYPPLAVQACQEAAHLLPDDAAPHYELALLYLSTLPNTPTPDALQPVVDELQIGHALEATQPPSEIFFAWNPYDDYSSLSDLITDRLNGLLNDSWNTTESPAVTSEAVAKQALSATPMSHTTPLPVPAVTEPLTHNQPVVNAGNGQTPFILTISGVVLLVLVGYLIVNRKR